MTVFVSFGRPLTRRRCCLALRFFYACCMEKYLYGMAALDFWKVRYLRGTLLDENEEVQAEYVVFTEAGKSVYCPPGYGLHSCRLKAARNFVSGKVCQARYAYIQVAKDLNKWQCLFLGYLLCAPQEGGAPALCTVESIRECVEALEGHPGIRNVRWALQYIKENSYSPMENHSMMQLALPVCHGGCGFKSLIFNHRILCRNGRVYYADLCDPAKKLIIEFDSKQHHSGKAKKKQDEIRRKHLEEEGYLVLSIGYRDLKSLRRFESLAKKVSRRLGKRLRVRARKYFRAFMILKDMLLQKYKKQRDHYSLVKQKQVPRFLGVSKYYKFYLWARKLRQDQLKIDVHPGL